MKLLTTEIQKICSAFSIEKYSTLRYVVKNCEKIGLKFINEFKYDNIPCNWYELNKEDYGKKMS